MASSSRDPNAWIELQKRSFTNWFKDRLQGNLEVAKVQVQDLQTDLKDGLLIIALLEQLAKPRKVGRYCRNPVNKLQCISNLDVGLRFITESENIKLVNIGPKDIYDGNLKLIMGLIWTLIDHYQIRSTGRGQLSTKQAMKEWLNTLIPEYGVQNFTTDWNDGRALCGLVDHLKPGLCPNHLLMNPKQALENCRLGMELAQKHFGIPAILDPEDLKNPDVDKLSVMTYLSYFFDPALKQLLEWIQHKIPQQKITNLSTDWNSGINLAALMAACHGLMPNWKELDPHNSLANMKECVEVAKRLMNIECPVAPSVLTDPKVDEIVMATYLSRFKYSKLMAQAKKLSTNLPYDVAVVGMPIEFNFDLGQDLTSAINDLEVTASGPTKSDKVDLTMGDKTSGSFIPSKTGDYEVDCKLNGNSIKGCPFKVIVIDPKEWTIAANVPQFLHLEKRLQLPVKGSDDRVKVTCMASDKEGNPVNFVDSSINTSGLKNRCNVILDPIAVGNAVISIKVAGIDVQKSPFPVKVCDVSHCTVSGLVGSGKKLIGDPIEFCISTVGAGDDKPKLSGKGPTSVYHPHVVEEREGKYKATFTPLEPGDHNINITFGRKKIPGSPFHKHIEALPDSGSCSVKGPGLGLTQATTLEPATFSVITPKKGLLNKPDTLVVKVTSEMNKEAEVKTEKEKNGAYLVTYIAQTEVDTVNASYQQQLKDHNLKEQSTETGFTAQKVDLSLQEMPDISDGINLSVGTVDAGVQANYLAVAPDFLHGVEVYGETVLEVVGDKSQKLEWPGYGFYIEVPDGALSQGVTASVAVKVILGGQFKLPANSQFISAIYWITSSKVFLKEVAVNIQHYAVIRSEEQCSKFRFIVAKCSQEVLPYTFREKEGLFNAHTKYGAIKVKHFSIFSQIGPKGTDLRITSLKFYKPKLNTRPLLVDFEFVVLYNHELFLKYVRKQYHSNNYQEDRQKQMLVFEKDEIVLDLPAGDSELKVVDGWKIRPLTYPQVEKVDLEQFRCDIDAPACTIALEWIGDGEPQQLSHQVNIIGAKKPANFFHIRYSPQAVGIHIFDEKPKFPMNLINVIQRECKLLRPLEDQYQAVKDFAATEVKVVIQSCNDAEYAAALEAIKRPPLPMFDKPVRYPNDENFTIVVGTFAGKNAAIVRTEQGTKCRDDLTTILTDFFPNATMLLGVGVCMGIKHKLGDVLVGEMIQLEETPKVRQGNLQLVGPCNEAEKKMRHVFCSTTGWNNFKCTGVPEGSDAKARISKAFSGCILSSPILLDDYGIKCGLESVTQPLIGVEMEGWVLFKYIEKDFPKIKSLIIKGICDYGDGTKSKDWQLTAAKAAVDYARFKLENAFM